MAILMKAFKHMAATGQPALILVSGYAGIGKSSLVRQMHEPIVAARGYFISGKFDPLHRGTPYATITQAFRELVQQILVESQERVAMWRQRLQEALGVNGQVIADLIPLLTLILGPQPPVPALPPTEAQNRFRMVFRKFIGVFARREHPLALLLDDLQWADSASLALIKELVAHPEVRHLFVIGAYRDNEVTPAHPLTMALDDARREGAHIKSVVLGPLCHGHLTELIRDALHCGPDEAAPLADLVDEKTNGNPFFVIQFLKALCEAHLILSLIHI